MNADEPPENMITDEQFTGCFPVGARIEDLLARIGDEDISQFELDSMLFKNSLSAGYSDGYKTHHFRDVDQLFQPTLYSIPKQSGIKTKVVEDSEIGIYSGIFGNSGSFSSNRQSGASSLHVIGNLPIHFEHPQLLSGQQSTPTELQATDIATQEKKPRPARKKPVKKEQDNVSTLLSKSYPSLRSSQKGTVEKDLLAKRLAGVIPKNLPLPSLFYPELLLDLEYWKKIHGMETVAQPFIRYSPCLWLFLRMPDFTERVYVWSNNLPYLGEDSNTGNSSICRVLPSNIHLVDTSGRYSTVSAQINKHFSLPSGCSMLLEDNCIKVTGNTAVFCMIFPAGRANQLHIPFECAGKGQSVLSKMHKLLYWPSDITKVELDAEISSKYYTVLHYDQETGDRILMMHNSITLGDDMAPYNWIGTSFLAATNNLEDRICNLREYLHLQQNDKREEIEDLSKSYGTRILYYPTGPVILFKCKGGSEINDDSLLPFTITDYFQFRQHMETNLSSTPAHKLMEYLKRKYKNSHTMDTPNSVSDLAKFARYLYEMAACWIYDGSDNFNEISSQFALCGDDSPFKRGKYATYSPYNPINPCAAIRSTISAAIALTCKKYIFLPTLWSDHECWNEFCLLGLFPIHVRQQSHLTETNLSTERNQNTSTCEKLLEQQKQEQPQSSNNLAQDIPPLISDFTPPRTLLTPVPDRDIKDLPNVGQSENDMNIDVDLVPKTPMSDIKEFCDTTNSCITEYVNDEEPPSPQEFIHHVDYRPHTPIHSSENYNRSQSSNGNETENVKETQTTSQQPDKDQENSSNSRRRNRSIYAIHIRSMAADIKKLSSEPQILGWINKNVTALRNIYFHMTVIRPSKGILTLCEAEKLVKQFISEHNYIIGSKTTKKTENLTLSSAISKKKQQRPRHKIPEISYQ